MSETSADAVSAVRCLKIRDILRPLLPWIAALTLTLVRVVLAYQTPVTVLLGQGTDADDALFVDQAFGLAQGKWLGSYGLYTLAKNPGYPIILAFCSVMHLRYQLVFILLHVCACAVFACAFRPRIRSRWLLVGVYLFMLYTPLLFTTTFFRRIYRDGIVIPFSLGTLSSYIGWYLRRDRPMRSQLVWALLASAFLVPLSLIKENYAWVLPFAAACSLVMLGARSLFLLRGGTCNQREWLMHMFLWILLLVLPFAAVRCAGKVVSTLNNQKYGIAATNERFSEPFSRVCSDLSAIDASDRRDGVWVTRGALSLAEEASPSLASISDDLDQSWDTWAQLFDGREVYGDMAYWALREAYGNAWGYKSAARTKEYWESVANELDAAVASGKLTLCGGLRVSQVAPPIGNSELAPWLHETCFTVLNLLDFQTMQEHLIGPMWTSPDPAPQKLEDELAARNLLGGNTLLNGAADDTPKRTAMASTIDWYLGRGMIAITRLLAIALLPALGTLVVLCCRRKVNRPLEPTLIVAGLLLTAFVFEAATVWYVSYQLAIFSTDSYLLEVYKYSPEFYVVASMLECFVFVELLGLEKFHVREDPGHSLVNARL